MCAYLKLSLMHDIYSKKVKEFKRQNKFESFARLRICNGKKGFHSASFFIGFWK